MVIINLNKFPSTVPGFKYWTFNDVATGNNCILTYDFSSVIKVNWFNVATQKWENKIVKEDTSVNDDKLLAIIATL